MTTTTTTTTNAPVEAEKRYYGATYSTDAHDFGEIISVFEVDADWDGYRFHGYCRLSAAYVAEAGL
jgi:hypothetical protein